MGISSEYAASFEDQRTTAQKLDDAVKALIAACEAVGAALKDGILDTDLEPLLITNEAELDSVLHGAR